MMLSCLAKLHHCVNVSKALCLSWISIIFWFSTYTCMYTFGPGGVLRLIFAGYVPLASQSPYPFLVYSVAIVDPILVTFTQICNFRDPNLVTFYLYIYFNYQSFKQVILKWIDPFFFNWIKITLLFTYSRKILVRLLTVNMKNCLTPKSRK